MSRHFVRFCVLLSTLFVGVLGAVFAHEARQISDGQYAIEFGWRSEPAYAGLLNGPEVFVALPDAEEGAPFPEDIEVSLQAEVTFGDQSTVVTFEPAWGETGHYVADLIPALPGDYRFHLTGTIGETVVDEIFTSADGQFGTAEPVSDILFPVIAPSDQTAKIAELEAKIAELEAAIAELKAK